jgi:hypothetical protein
MEEAALNDAPNYANTKQVAVLDSRIQRFARMSNASFERDGPPNKSRDVYRSSFLAHGSVTKLFTSISMLQKLDRLRI